MTLLLQTARLSLRPFTAEDAAGLFALDDDPEVLRYIGPVRLADVAAYRELIVERWLPYFQKNPGYGFFAAENRATGAFLGWFHLRNALDYRFAREAAYQPGDVDLGYRLMRHAWGQGLASEGAQALVAKAWTDPAVQRVVACALVSNRASLRVMEKAGLRFDGHFTIPGYEMLARYVRARQA